ncbi:Pathogenic type III effector avirulence factor Avr cleavage site [Heracleum sosnowskyi]|uniref:Pathogenic type III effector avirulence factor Avr cleavage site n=1 Tax=Heracleum sosnowskyi TaxID=360622 RepID=A0AAD8LYJ9_9APIA|nr:Pathogenic type III effector avirulence factor Avr cleavage site [Heracleum sosnowskyi]
MDAEFKKSHVPAFGSWDCNDDLPFTQCFESARQAGLLRYSYSQDRDLYVAGDLYQNDVVTPAMIVVPRRRAKAGHSHVKEGEKEGWVVCECEHKYDVKQPPSPVSHHAPPPRKLHKAVDEDLYKISPDLLYAKSKRKGAFGLFSCCLRPSCDL